VAPDTLGQRLRRFVRWGVYTAAVLSLTLIPTLVRTGNRPIPGDRITPFQIAIVYVLAGIIGGSLVAFLYPLSRWFLGAFLLGAVATTPVFVGLGFLTSANEPSSATWIIAGVGTFFVGGSLGTLVWSTAHRGPDLPTLISLWAIAVVCQVIGWYLGSRWPGEPPATIGIALVLLPLLPALLATVSRWRRRI
jgi:hypothetical protein